MHIYVVHTTLVGCTLFISLGEYQKETPIVYRVLQCLQGVSDQYIDEAKIKQGKLLPGFEPGSREDSDKPIKIPDANLYTTRARIRHSRQIFDIMKQGIAVSPPYRVSDDVFGISLRTTKAKSFFQLRFLSLVIIIIGPVIVI